MAEEPSVVDIAHARSDEYRRALTQIAQDGNCPAPYCQDKADYHTHEIDDSAQYWRVTQNSFNYKDARLKFLIIHKVHIENILDMTLSAWTELHDIVRRLVAEHDIKGATLMMRFGDKSFTGGSVTHLHAHLIAGYPRAKNSPPITTLIAYGRLPESPNNEEE